MTKTNRLDTDKAMQRLLGRTESDAGEAPPAQDLPKTAAETETVKISMFLTKAQRRALKQLAAVSELPEHRDMSAIIRQAIDEYIYKYKNI